MSYAISMNGKAAHVAYHRLGDYYGHKRIYIENLAVLNSGFAPGVRYSIRVDEERREMRITLDPTGPRTVTKREKGTRILPVIDIKSLTFDRIAHEAERARVEFRQHEIVVRIHRDHVAEGHRRARVESRLANGDPLRIVSLCSGAGILDAALVDGLSRGKVQADVALAVELEERVLEAALMNNAAYRSANAVFGRIEDVEQWPLADILVAGLPCVGASQAGRAARHGAAPEEHPQAGALYLHFLLAVQNVNPAAIVLENVPSYRNSESMAAIRAFLELKGYELHERVMVGTEMGDLERRSRFAMVAVTRGLTFSMDDVVAVRTKPANLGAIMEPIPLDAPCWQHKAHIAAKLERDREKGNNFRPQPVNAASEECPTISAGYTHWRTCDPRVPHPSGDGRERLLTPKEHAAIKGVPLHLLRSLSDSQMHHTLGNAVTYHAWVAVGLALGKALRSGVMRATEQLALIS